MFPRQRLVLVVQLPHSPRTCLGNMSSSKIRSKIGCNLFDSSIMKGAEHGFGVWTGGGGLTVRERRMSWFGQNLLLMFPQKALYGDVVLFVFLKARRFQGWPIGMVVVTGFSIVRERMLWQWIMWRSRLLHPWILRGYCLNRREMESKSMMGCRTHPCNLQRPWNLTKGQTTRLRNLRRK